jgi:CHAD domain-containing protein
VREFAHRQTAILLCRLATQLNRAARRCDPDAIRDLRVAIRHLSRCLRAFAQFYSGHGWKRMRRRLKDLLDACGNVHDRDLALEVLAKSGFPPESVVVRRLNLDRHDALVELMTQLNRWKGRGTARKWREQLGI